MCKKASEKSISNAKSTYLTSGKDTDVHKIFWSHNFEGDYL